MPRCYIGAVDKSRRYIMLSLLGLAATGIICRAVYLQLIHKDFLQARGDERHLRVVQVPAHRGMIVDRHGKPLAVSSPVDSAWAEPRQLLQYRHYLPALATLLETSPAALERKLITRSNREFVYLRRHLNPPLAQQVQALGFPGVRLKREYRRYYPTGEVSAHLLGFTDIDDRGQEGLELVYNSRLQGIPGSKRVIRDLRGRSIEDVESIRMPEPGQTLRVSIDSRIQYLAYRALKVGYLKHKANSAAAVVVDADTGEILAMVNQPAANPNSRRNLQAALLRNRVVTDEYEPGSTLKPFTVAMALESGAYHPYTLIDTRPGYMAVGRRLVRDIHNYGRINVAEALIKSSNVGISMIALSLPAEGLWTLYQQLGFGEVSGLGFSGERQGVLRHFSTWSLIGHANHAFGYGLAVTTLQLAQAYTVLAADGLRRPLSLMHREKPASKPRRLFSAATAAKIRHMLELAVTNHGTGSQATVPGYRVAGKTGTVRKVKDGRYLTGHYRSLFAGMAPASQPRLVVVVVIDEPKQGEYYGGKVAAPVFSKIMEGALSILNVAPDAVPTASVQWASETR